MPNVPTDLVQLKIQPVNEVFFTISPSPFELAVFETAIVVVRHAEKETGDDPVLKLEGERRAESLARRLDAFPLDAVYSTDTRRTRQTAEPSAREAGLAITDYSRVGDLIADLAGRGGGQRILVVGHSDTVGTIVHRLGGPPGIDIPEEEFDHFFAVVRTANDVLFWRGRY